MELEGDVDADALVLLSICVVSGDNNPGDAVDRAAASREVDGVTSSSSELSSSWAAVGAGWGLGLGLEFRAVGVVAAGSGLGLDPAAVLLFFDGPASVSLRSWPPSMFALQCMQTRASERQ
jgi:hypothetical protein